MNLKKWILRNKVNIMGLVIVIILFLGMFVLKSARNYSNGWISYKGRTYAKSSKQVISEGMKKNFNEAKPTGKYILGNEIYDIPNNPYHSTVIFIKTRDGRFEIYELRGGP